MREPWINKLYYGNNLPVMRQHLDDEIVDLVYLDPPFNSNAAYNVLFAERDGSRSQAQAHAFEDTWHWGPDAAECYEDVVERGGEPAEAMVAFRKLLGQSDMMAYLSMMAPRLVELRRVLKPRGSLYLHCDPTASHYLKILLDAVFGGDRFQNEIIWSYRRWPSPSNHYQRMHDVILFYAKSKNGPGTFNMEYEPNSESYQRRFKGKTQMLDPETKTRKITLTADSRGLPRRDVWDLSIIAGFSKERLGYPTQKPEKLLERIIETSSNAGDLVFDPFCGCGTTVAVAQRLRRRWIGIDITHAAMVLMKDRLARAFGGRVKYRVIGEPTSVPDAQALASSDPYQFQWWALGLVGARPAEEKKGADRGIDGRLFFHDEPAGGQTKEIVLSVKAGHTNVAHIRDLGHVVEREGAVIGVLITMREPTQPMKAEAAAAGFYTHRITGKRYPKLQILTVDDLLAKKLIDRPYASEPTATFKAAPPAKGKQPKQEEMELGE
ncbi:MAG: site-specific DNA-methyltransferase [Armatimonadetes bacterium]|nr:site-specific DNA-methyltransferase [Armatimonadota bacterium]